MTDQLSIQERLVPTDEGMQALGVRFAEVIKPGQIIFLIGSLGAGKTTFVRGFLRGLGYEGKVKSPTYTLVEPYDTDKLEVFHFDLYRLNHPDELQQLGLENYFTPTSVCLIEWPDQGGDWLPPPDIVVNFAIMESLSGDNDGSPIPRQLRFIARTQEGDEILARL